MSRDRPIPPSRIAHLGPDDAPLTIVIASQRLMQDLAEGMRGPTPPYPSPSPSLEHTSMSWQYLAHGVDRQCVDERIVHPQFSGPSVRLRSDRRRFLFFVLRMKIPICCCSPVFTYVQRHFHSCLMTDRL